MKEGYEHSNFGLVPLFRRGEHSPQCERRVGAAGNANAGFGDLREYRSRGQYQRHHGMVRGLHREQVKAVIEFAACSLDRAPAVVS